uniref:Uncharacterized protein n=1 Tax=Oryza sativa subsp. japonica TaxID=39947 RepID=Q5VPR9_ORYSJ|nr:hypothetical protein [Oryza sativa Japonica Group]
MHRRRIGGPLVEAQAVVVQSCWWQQRDRERVQAADLGARWPWRECSLQGGGGDPLSRMLEIAGSGSMEAFPPRSVRSPPSATCVSLSTADLRLPASPVTTSTRCPAKDDFDAECTDDAHEVHQS